MRKATRGLLLFLILVGASHWAAAIEWGRTQNPSTGATLLKRALTSAGSAPILNDPSGDDITSPGNPVVDIEAVQGGSNGTAVTLKVLFSSDTVMSHVVGYIELDTDQNPSTGGPPSANSFIPGTTQDLGVEFVLNLFDLPLGGAIGISSVATGISVGSVPATIVGQTLEFTVPLTMLGGDDGVMNVGMVLGNEPQPTDAAPDTGHGVILGGPTPVGGTATGINTRRVICRNDTTRQTVKIQLKGAASWDCVAAGLVVHPGDIIVQRVRGAAN